ncbi:MAG TPA: SusC/RagA family TonB-linked outer membrane protein, partial [Chitinophagaceae bacterium]
LVVTALGVKREARSLGYGTSTVNSKELTESKPVNVATGLVGRVAGLQINTINNGVDPAVRITLRGNRHINSDNQALIVVDGVPVRSDFLATLDPNDILNISVLKGASAAALYGSEATNGVLIVTTKKGGQGGKPVIHFSNATTFSKLSYFPALQSRFGGYGGETTPLPWNNQPTVNQYTGFPNYVPFENQSYGPEFNGDTTGPAGQGYGYVGGPEANGSFLRTPYKAITPDQRIAFFVTGVTTQNDLSYSGGDDKDSYFMSVQDVSITGTVPKDKSRRTSARFNGKKTYGIFSAQFDLNYSRKSSDVVGGDFSQGRPVYWNVLNTPANVPLTKLKDWKNNPFADVNGYYNAYYPNPYWQIDNTRNTLGEDNVQATLTLNLQPVSWLNLLYRAGAVITNDAIHNSSAAVSFSPYALGDPWQAGNIAASVKLKNGSVNDFNYYYRRLSEDLIATFNKKFGDFSADLFVGGTIWDRYYKGIDVGSSNIFVPGFYNVSARLGELGGGEGISDERRLRAFSDLTLGYKDYIFLHGSLSRDWSSLLAKGNNAYNFYDVDASFVFTDAVPGLKSSPWLSYGKIRAAYSITGQISVGPYSIQNVFTPAYGFPFGSTPGLILGSRYNNPGLKPEKTKEKEVGLDLGLWNDRINLTASYYQDNTVDQTFPVNLSTTTGFSSAFVNGGNVQSSGLEIGVNATPVKSAGGFRWDLGGNISVNNSKVISLYGGSKEFQIVYNNGNGSYDYAIVGQPYPVLKVNDLIRDPANGKVVISTVDGYPHADSKTVNVGRSTPKYILGLHTSLSYKHFTLSGVADYRGGYNFYAFLGQQLDFTGASAHTAQNGRQSFIFPNSELLVNGKYEPNTSVATQSGNIGFWVGSDYTGTGTSYIISGDAWKLRTISLSYDFTDLIHQLKFIKGLTFTVVGNNLLMWRPSQNTWTDPEFNVDNSNAVSITDYNQLPPSRSYGASISLTF